MENNFTTNSNANSTFNFTTNSETENIFTILIGISAIILNLGFGATLDATRVKGILFKNDNNQSIKLNLTDPDRPDNRMECCKKCPINGPLATTIFVQMAVNPFFGFLCAQLTTVAPAKVMGILIMSSASGAASSWWSIITYGVVELSLSLTVITTILSTGFLPLYTYLFTTLIWDAGASGLKINYVVILLGLIITLVPNIIGYLIRSKAPCGNTCVARLIIFTKPFGLFVLVLVMLGAFVIYPVSETIAELGPMVWVQCFLMNSGGMLIGFFTSKLFGFDEVYHRTMMWEIGAQNQGVAIQIVNLSYSGQTRAIMLTFSVVYQLMSALAAIPTGLLLRSKYPTWLKAINERDEKNIAEGICINSNSIASSAMTIKNTSVIELKETIVAADMLDAVGGEVVTETA